MAGRTRRLKLTLAYDGTDLHGFQIQGRRPTVQLYLERALTRVAGHPVRVTPAGRTDAGVHAAGQVVHCDLHGRIPTERVPAALNSLLPPEIVVYAGEEAPASFHARYSATAKVYRYSVLESPHAWPFIRRYVLHSRERHDWDRVAQSIPYLKGRRDFAAFQSAGSPVRSTVRNLRRIDIQRQDMGWGIIHHITFEGDGFLYRMVRNLVGTLLEIGAGRRPPSWAAEVLESGDRLLAGPTAPPQGLTLLEVRYDGPAGAGPAAGPAAAPGPRA